MRNPIKYFLIMIAIIVGAYIIINIIEKKLINEKYVVLSIKSNNCTREISEDDIDKRNLMAVFVYYRIPVRLNIRRQIEIPKEINSDIDFICTVIHKSQDVEWIKRHILLSSDSTGYAF